VVGGLVLSAALPSFLTGITQPQDFRCVLVLPVLYVIHPFFHGLACMMLAVFNITIVQTLGVVLIDFLVFLLCLVFDMNHFLCLFKRLVVVLYTFYYLMYYKAMLRQTSYGLSL